MSESGSEIEFGGDNAGYNEGVPIEKYKALEMRLVAVVKKVKESKKEVRVDGEIAIQPGLPSLTFGFVLARRSQYKDMRKKFKTVKKEAEVAKSENEELKNEVEEVRSGGEAAFATPF